MKISVLTIRLLICLSIPLLTFGCNYVNESINESIVKPERVAINPENSAPIIKEIVVPTEVHAGARIQLQAVTEDADGDTLTYNWSVEEGMLSSETTPTPTWTTPIELGFSDRCANRERWD